MSPSRIKRPGVGSFAKAPVPSSRTDFELFSRLCREVLKEPSNPRHLANFSIALSRDGASQAAYVAMSRASRLGVDRPRVHRLLGRLEAGPRHSKRWRRSLRRAHCLSPDDAETLAMNGFLMMNEGAHDDALQSLRRAKQVAPRRVATWMALSDALAALGRLEEARQNLYDLIDLVRDSQKVHSSVIFQLDQLSDWTISEQQEIRKIWWERHGVPLFDPLRQHDNDADPERRLRVGYVSADFRDHSARDVFGSIILNHDKKDVEVFLYSNNDLVDEHTLELKGSVDFWRDVYDLTDDAMASRISEDRIDILVDLSGHTNGNRLTVFARKPAPVQVTAWGHAVGTGLAAIDYFLTDPVFTPPEFRAHFAETCLDLPCAVPFTLPTSVPMVAAPPRRRNGWVTFGSFNRVEKLNHEVFRLWARILRVVPSSRLFLKAAAFGTELERRATTRAFESLGIEPSRILYRGATSRHEHLANYANVDIVLDSFPQTGGVTTWEASYMGVPVVTKASRFSAHLGSASILNAVGLNEFQAVDESGYVDLAVKLANDGDRLDRHRATLRDRVLNSPGTNFATYARAVEKVYRGMWRQWCATRGRATAPSRAPILLDQRDGAEK
jgi:predicted O-linked N-acetylglucosamine transferase (SPINDLY family)